MKINDKGELIIDLWDGIEHLPKEEKLKLIETLSCADDVIKHVADQLIDGFTENVYFGSDLRGQAEPSTELGKQRRRIALSAGEIAAKEIKGMERSVNYHALKGLWLVGDGISNN